ncbi:MAG: aldose 1-epimerase, partial [Clostridia bacterium]|nr:aldose 1-epimerase [Clostridia bacterium]
MEKLEYKGKSVLNPLQNEKEWRENPFVQGSPLLFPANRTAGARFSFRGREYLLPVTEKDDNLNKHGLLYCQRFWVQKVLENSITLRFENTGEIYPFNFVITAEYTLENGGARQKFTIDNTGTTDMPYTFALHTSFLEPAYFRVPISYVHEKDEKHIPTGRYLPLSGVEAAYAAGIDPRGVPISGYYKANGHTAVIGDWRYTVSDSFDHFILYNAGGKSGYLCIEPQAGAVNGLNTPSGHRIIPLKGREILETFI